MVGTGVLSAGDIGVLADLPSRDALLAQFAGALAAPLRQLASLIEALPRNLAYGLSALIDQRQASGEVLEAAPETAAEAAPAEDAADSAPPVAEQSAEPPVAEAAETPAAEADAPAEAEAAAEADAPESAAPADGQAADEAPGAE
jgi:large subunit ribosomal protein L10